MMIQKNHNNFFDRLEEVVLANLDNEDFSIDDLANLLYLSNSQVFRKIKKKTGLSPSNYIQKKRLEEAAILIKKSDLSISEIAYRVGFNTISYFSRSFSAYYGYPPSQLRA